MTECYVGTTKVSTKGSPFLPNLANSGSSYCSPEFPLFALTTSPLNISQALQERLPSKMTSQLQRRSMVVKRLNVFPIESIVRGHITGSAWSFYQKYGTVCSIALPTGLQESEEAAVTPLDSQYEGRSRRKGREHQPCGRLVTSDA